jgi:hypothetical protein
MSLSTPDKPMMTRSGACKLINSLGLPISQSHFAKICLPSRKEGPPVAARWGLRPMYREDDIREWVMVRSAKYEALFGDD